MTLMQPRCSVNESVSPIETNHAAPVYGAAAGNMEPTVDMPEIVDEATEAPEDKDEEQARGKPEESEDEMRVPRV